MTSAWGFGFLVLDHKKISGQFPHTHTHSDEVLWLLFYPESLRAARFSNRCCGLVSRHCIVIISNRNPQNMGPDIALYSLNPEECITYI